jgi:hypothetical protein
MEEITHKKKLMLKLNKPIRRSRILWKSQEKYCYEDIFIFYLPGRNCYIKKNWEKVKFFREKDINNPN